MNRLRMAAVVLLVVLGHAGILWRMAWSPHGKRLALPPSPVVQVRLVALVQQAPAVQEAPVAPPHRTLSRPPQSRPRAPTLRHEAPAALPSLAGIMAPAVQDNEGPAMAASGALSSEPVAKAQEGPDEGGGSDNKVSAVAISVVCGRQVKPAMPARAVRDGLQGTVSARITLKAGKVVDVAIVQSRPHGVFDEAVRRAVFQYQCDTPGDAEVVTTQVFEFKLE